MASDLHVSEHAIYTALEFLRENELAHIKAWVRSPVGTPAAIWTAGSGEDAPMPEPFTAAEKSARWRAKGNDGGRAVKIRRQMKRIEESASIAGMLGCKGQMNTGASA